MKFDRQGDGLARYTIMNYRKLPNKTGYDYKVRPVSYSFHVNFN